MPTASQVSPSSALVSTSLLTTTITVFGGPGVTVTLCASGLSIAPSSETQVSPPSVLCRTSSTSIDTHTLRWSSGSMAMPVTRGVPTAGHSATTSTGRCSQLSPPSRDLKIPAGVWVPVAANITCGSTGSTARAHTNLPLSAVSSSRQESPASSLR